MAKVASSGTSPFDLQHRRARDGNAQARDPLAVVVRAAHVQRLAGEATGRVQLVARPQGVLRTPADIEAEPTEHAALLTQQRRTQADEAAVLLLETGRGRVEPQPRLGAAQGEPGRGVLERHGPRQHLHFVQRDRRRDPRTPLAAAFQRAADADAGVPHHDIAFDTQRRIAEGGLQLGLHRLEVLLQGRELGVEAIPFGRVGRALDRGRVLRGRDDDHGRADGHSGLLWYHAIGRRRMHSTATRRAVAARSLM